MIIDAHVHIFNEIKTQPGLATKRDLGYGAIGVGDQTVRVLPPLNIRTTHTVQMLIAGMDWAGVEKAVLLQGPFYGECNREVLDAVRRYPDRLVGAGYFDPWGDTREKFAATFDSSVFCALKIEFTMGGLSGIHKGARLDLPGMEWLWDELERRHLVLTIDLGAPGDFCYQTDALHAIATTHPDLRIVICHLALPKPEIEAKPELWQLWLDQIDLGHLENVWFDCSALPYYLIDESFPFPTVGRYLKLAIERIGPSRIMWGTDIPALLTVLTYPQLVKMARVHTAFLSEGEQDLVLSKNAESVYGV
jgi:predicted TIM-barrel fold metal-dependent hydrolase